jgi:two-component sensor histidine kinase
MPKPGSRLFEIVPAYTVEPGTPAAWALAVGCPLAAVGVRWLVGLFDATIPPFHLIFAATLLVTIMAGRVAGVTAVLIGLAASWLAFGAEIPAAFTLSSILLYALSCVAIVLVSDEYRRLLRRYQEKEEAVERQMLLIKSENEVLSRVAEDAGRKELLELICRSAEDYSDHKMLASVLLLDEDGRHLRHGAAPSLPASYASAIDGLEIGPSVGSCGTAAYRKEPVFVADIASDPLWADYRDLALRHGLRACWSVPIISGAHGVLGTFALYHRESRIPTEEEKEAIDLMTRIATLAMEHQRSKELRQLLVEELTHRVKNMFTVVISLAARSLRGRSDEAAYTAFENRLRAMADTQSLLTQANWSSVDFRELVSRIAVAPFCGPGDRFHLEGPSVPVPAQYTLPLALSLHELSTNASKYGALTSESGHVDIRWDLGRNNAAQRELHMSWTESGGPPVEAPGEPGFGSRMIKSAFSAGDVTLDYRKEGLVCEIRLPLTQQPAGTGVAAAPGA